MEGASLSIEGVTVGYGGSEPVLRGVSLGVSPGEFIALLGSSGCGKTTLLRAISGFVPIRSGRVLASGRDISHVPSHRRNMAMVFQSYALWPHMSVAQNIGYGLKLRRRSRREISAKVDSVLAMLRLEGLGRRSVTQLSGGQRQRVALGRALAVDPQFLLLDEPLSNLDAQVRVDVRHEIKALQHNLGITTIHVTHDREEAMVMADRLVILNAGEIAQVGSPEEVYNRPVSPFVAAFMGANNVMPLEVTPEAEVIRVRGNEHVFEAELVRGDAQRPGIHLPETISRTARAHFRSETARLVVDGTASRENLVLRGRIAQSSYPGGFYRYAVEVGDRRFMVDDPRRLAVGDTVGVSLPAESLYLYPANASGPGPATNNSNRDASMPTT